MSEPWRIGDKRPSTISDWKKLLIDFRDQFPYDPLTALVVETFANSVDAGATSIGITIDGDVYRILDNGRGMSQSEFEEYHNIASLSKKKGETIGFAGVGAKVFLDRALYAITETKSGKFHGATRWGFLDSSSELTYEVIDPPNRIPFETGTSVEIILKEEEDKKELKVEFVKDVLLQHYNALLMGYYRPLEVRINGQKIEPWMVPRDQIEYKKEINEKLGSHRIRGFFIKSKTEIPEEFQGLSIVVFGKTVQSGWLKEYCLSRDKITGIVLADHLITILTTSKTQFNYSSMLWKKFKAKIGKIFSMWLEEIGERQRPREISNDMGKLIQELEGSLNEVLKSPEFNDISNRLFQNITRRSVPIQSELGDFHGSIVDGAQTTTGTLGGAGDGGGVLTVGNEEGEGVVEDEKGDAPVERVKRRVRGGIKIGLDDRPEIGREGWMDLDQQTIIINIGHPGYKIAEGLTYQAKAQHVLVYHNLKAVINTIIKDLELPEETAVEMLTRWYELYIKPSG